MHPSFTRRKNKGHHPNYQRKISHTSNILNAYHQLNSSMPRDGGSNEPHIIENFSLPKQTNNKEKIALLLWLAIPSKMYAFYLFILLIRLISCLSRSQRRYSRSMADNINKIISTIKILETQF